MKQPLKYPHRPRAPLWLAWRNMRARCNNPNQKDYKHYGGRGIQVCQRWNSYKIFAADVGPHPGGGFTLDRIDNNRGYEPGNVRWATRTEQVRNSRMAKLDTNQVKQIRDAHKAGARQNALAIKFGVSKALICLVVNGEVWK